MMNYDRYAQNKLFSITNFTKQIGSAVGSIKEHSLEKAVVISTDEYERVKKLEERYELAKHTEIYNIVQERKKIPIS